VFVLSYVKVARQEFAPKNTFDAFFPFVVAAADPQNGLEYQPYAIGERLRSSLGWGVGGDFVDLFTEGLEKRKFLTSESPDGRRFWTAAAARPDAGQAEADIDHLKAAFFEFTDDLSGLWLHNVNADERLYSLATALVTNRLFSADALQEYADREVEDLVGPAPEGATLSGPDFDYLCARFIQTCHKNDLRSFNALVGLANIGVVTQLANFFHHRTDDIEKTGSPTLILDGPFLLDYAGLNGEVRRADAAIIIDSARQRNCKIWAFRHSIAEARDIVNAVVLSDPRERYGPLAAALRNRSVTIENLEAFLDDPFGIINRLNIVDSIFDVDRKTHKWEDEDFTEDDWQAVYAKLLGWKDLARKRDCQSILGVMRLRASHFTKNPWDTRFFLLTSNSGLARLAKEACVGQNLIDENQVGPAISRNEFAAIVWLAGDPKNRNEAITSHLLAAAQGMLARDRSLVDKVREYTENLSDGRKEFVDAVLQTELSYELLQDITLGNPDRITDDSFDRVINTLVEQGKIAGAQEARAEDKRATRRLREEATAAKADREIAEEAARSAAQLADSADRTRALAEARADAALAEKEQAEQARRDSEAQARQNLDIATRARTAIEGVLTGTEADWTRVAGRIERGVAGFLVIVVLILAAATAFFGWELRQATGVAVAIFVCLVAAVAVMNDTIKSARAKLQQDWVEAWIRRALKNNVRRLERRMGLPSPFIVIQQIEGRVRISNKDAVLGELEKRI
jgi:hypothetical protein